MTKIPRDKSPSPSASQLAGVRRAASHGDASKARQRLAALRKSFPTFKPLLGLAWEIEDLDDMPMLAAARAHEWLQAMPNSRAAAEALMDSARSAGLSALSARAAQRLRALEEHRLQDTGPPPFEFLGTPLQALSFEQAEAIDLSRMHLVDRNPSRAVAVLKDVDHPSARNNLALALFADGDVLQALAVVEANWQAGPDNMFGLERALRWRCWHEGLDHCQDFVAHLQQATPQRTEDAISQVAALHFLNKPDAARRAWEDTAKASYWELATDEQHTLFDALAESAVDLPSYQGLWFPDAWARKMAAIARGASDKDLDADTHAPWNIGLDTCDAHVDYLVRAAELGDATTRLMALTVLKRRAQLDDRAACESLHLLLKRPCGPDKVRLDLLSWMVEQGLQSRDEPVQPRNGS